MKGPQGCEGHQDTTQGKGVWLCHSLAADLWPSHCPQIHSWTLSPQKAALGYGSLRTLRDLSPKEKEKDPTQLRVWLLAARPSWSELQPTRQK